MQQIGYINKSKLNPIMLKKIRDMDTKFSLSITLEDKLDTAYEIYLESSIALIDAVDSEDKAEIEKLQNAALKFMKTLLNVKDDEEMLELVKKREQFKVYDSAYSPGSPIESINKIQIKIKENNEKSKEENEKLQKTMYQMNRLRILSNALDKQQIMRVNDEDKAEDLEEIEGCSEIYFYNYSKNNDQFIEDLLLSDYNIQRRKSIITQPSPDNKFLIANWVEYDKKNLKHVFKKVQLSMQDKFIADFYQKISNGGASTEDVIESKGNEELFDKIKLKCGYVFANERKCSTIFFCNYGKDKDQIIENTLLNEYHEQKKKKSIIMQPSPDNKFLIANWVEYDKDNAKHVFKKVQLSMQDKLIADFYQTISNGGASTEGVIESKGNEELFDKIKLKCGYVSSAGERTRTVYMTHSNRAKNRVIIREDGLCYKPKENTKLAETDLFELCDTSQNIAHGRKQYAAYTINQYGEISIFSHFGLTDGIAHSSMNSGVPVFGAGELKIVQGKITDITVHSGHYKPTDYNVYQILKFFEKQGVDISNINIHGWFKSDTIKIVPDTNTELESFKAVDLVALYDKELLKNTTRQLLVEKLAKDAKALLKKLHNEISELITYLDSHENNLKNIDFTETCDKFLYKFYTDKPTAKNTDKISFDSMKNKLINIESEIKKDITFIETDINAHPKKYANNIAIEKCFEKYDENTVSKISNVYKKIDATTNEDLKEFKENLKSKLC